MKSVILGGSGFLGSHVADALMEQGHDVTLFDIRPSAYIHANQRIVIGDILDADALDEVLRGCDYLYHFAGIADLDSAATTPLDTVSMDVMGTATVLDAAVRRGVKRFIYASTVYVYSDLGGFYRCSKQAGELYVEEYQRQFGLNYTILRYGTLYGPRANHHNSVWRYLKQGFMEGKIDFCGTGEETREYIHVRDAAKLSVDILSERFKNQPIIITGHHPMKAKDMLNMIREILKNQVAIEFLEPLNDIHYNLTPYSFMPKIGNKLVSNCYVDMGQGLLECLHEISAGITTTESTTRP